MSASPELTGQTWSYRFTMPRGGWPILTWPHPSRTVRMQVREIRVTVRRKEDGTLEAELLRTKGRWVPGGGDTSYRSLRMPHQATGLGMPTAPDWILELVSTAVQAASEQS